MRQLNRMLWHGTCILGDRSFDIFRQGPPVPWNLGKRREKENTMLNSRSTHYWLWFLLFGVVAALAKGFTTETAAVSITGALGLLTGIAAFRGTARIYDLIVGLLFTLLGLLGVIMNLGLGQKVGVNAAGDIFGLSLQIPYSLIHTVLGLTSLNHGLKPAPVAPAVTVTEHTQPTSA
jgi:hypothetical protein